MWYSRRVFLSGCQYKCSNYSLKTYDSYSKCIDELFVLPRPAAPAVANSATPGPVRASLVGPRTARRWHPVRRGDVNVHVVSDGELCVAQRLSVIRALLPRTGHADFAHPVHGRAVRRYDGKVKVGSLAARLRVHVPHQRGQLAQRRVHPGVDLQLVCRHVAVVVLGSRVVPAGGAEHAQQQRTRLAGGIEPKVL